MKITGLKTEYMVSPIGIDTQCPSFSWMIETEEKNIIQEAYIIHVLDRSGDVCWDSGKINTSRMIDAIYNGKELKSNEVYFWTVSVFLTDGRRIDSDPAKFETGIFNCEEWQADWIGETDDWVYHVFSKKFSLSKSIKRAKAYICGLGHYEAYINGKRVGTAVLEPGWTNYNKCCLYSSLDITELVKIGNNAIGIILGDGMFNVPGGRYVYFTRSYGKCKLLLKLCIEYEDGTTESIVSNQSWLMHKSPLTFSCIYGGEDYDARIMPNDFSMPDFDESKGWENAIKVSAPLGKLTSQTTNQLKVIKTYKPLSVKQLDNKSRLYDFGTNMSGWVKINITALRDAQGTVITVYPGELLDSDGLPKPFPKQKPGLEYHWQYTLNSSLKQEYAPKFTYFGFRYALLKLDLPDGLPADDLDIRLTAEFIYPENIETGTFECSSDLFNKIHAIIRQAMLSNIKSYMTDCPHREKLPWLEQSHLIGPGIMYNFDVRTLYQKVEADMAQSQRENGLIPDICPEYVVFGYHEGYVDSPEWGSAVIINPYYLYRRFGDKRIFEKYYDTMKKYADYLETRLHHYVLHHGLGDWLDIGPVPPHSQNTPVPVVATCVYYLDLRIMAEAAQMLNKAEDEKHFRSLMEKVKEEFNLQFFYDQTNKIANGSQAAQAMALISQIAPDDKRQKIFDVLARDIERRGYATTAGDVGHPFMVAALEKFNRGDILYKMTCITDKPGYGYQVVNGATTLTEDWDGPDPKHPHGSQNHLMLGGIEEWFYGGLAGLDCIREETEFDNVFLRPEFPDGIDYIKAKTLHPYGVLEISWQRRDDKIIVEFTIPAGAKGTFENSFNGERSCYGSGTYALTIDAPKSEAQM